MSFKPGDVVRLKSGGEKMTVESLSDELVHCVWFVDKKVQRESFEGATLKEYVAAAIGSSRSNFF
ncbi:YodC family protein [Sphingomonas sp. PP-CE-3A-406]|uniref:YodC family protein n=1 Tax=Sphingomonas sp. PP-CE-3A-406 TaxID=2135659 RepID=UPI000EF9A520|nr:DUF2158 domain-containing protein [Sphingomonas sp. PP-CE-3A-406]